MASNNKQLIVKYYECRHNYAARSMGHALDGCGEFCPTDAPGTPKALICAACHCHRNFHRRVEEELENGVEIHHPTDATPLVILDGPPPQYLVKPRAQVVEALLENNNSGDNSEKETKGEVLQMAELEVKDPSNSSFPVKMKLSPDQKEKVLAFTQEIMRWKWSKNNEQVIPFCAEVGITPLFLKNWINNNRRRIGPLKKISKTKY